MLKVVKVTPQIFEQWTGASSKTGAATREINKIKKKLGKEPDDILLSNEFFECCKTTRAAQEQLIQLTFRNTNDEERLTELLERVRKEFELAENNDPDAKPQYALVKNKRYEVTYKIGRKTEVSLGYFENYTELSAVFIYIESVPPQPTKCVLYVSDDCTVSSELRDGCSVVCIEVEKSARSFTVPLMNILEVKKLN